MKRFKYQGQIGLEDEGFPGLCALLERLSSYREWATLNWVDWFNNHRLLEPIGNIPPAEAEANHYSQSPESAMSA